MTPGFGLEKLGLVSLRYPWLSLLIASLLTPLAIYGASKLEFSSDIRDIFRSAESRFETLETLRQQFPGTKREIQIVVESESTFKPKQLGALKNLHGELADISGVHDVLSMFSALVPSKQGNGSAPLFPADLAEREGWEDLRQRATHHPLIANKLLSEDGSLAVFSLALRDENREAEEARNLIQRVRSVADDALSNQNLTFQLTGLAVMRLEIINALARDQTRFRIIALAMALAICWVFFQRLSFVAMAGAPAAVAVSWLLGGMWLAGQKITLLTGIAPTVVLVIVFSDCVHLLFSIQDELRDGQELKAAIERSVRRVGPACVLTSLTTTLALGSLIFVPHPFISNFGATAAAGTAVALIATLTIFPALSLILLRYFKTKSNDENRNIARRSVDKVCHRAASAVETAPGTITSLGVVLVLAGGWLHSLNEPRYSYVSNLPQESAARKAIEAVNNQLAGANTLEVLIRWPQDYGLRSPNTLSAIRDVHEAVSKEEAFGGVSSLHSVADWLDGNGAAGLKLLEFFQASDGSLLAEHLIAPEHNSALVTAQFKDLTSAELVPVLDRLKRRLDKLEKRYPEADFSATGVVPISAQASDEMLRQLNRSLLIAISVILVVIALALRSLRLGLVSILPNVFPIAVGGAYLYLVEGGLQFTSLVAFTVGFGIAVDSTIHILNRYELTISKTQKARSALHSTITTVGPVIVICTVVLAAGLGTSLLSDLPMVRLYGAVVVTVLVAALFGDLLFLPALMAVIDRWRRWQGPSAKL